jgi:hypothetical protein
METLADVDQLEDINSMYESSRKRASKTRRLALLIRRGHADRFDILLCGRAMSRIYDISRRAGPSFRYPYRTVSSTCS